METRLESPTVCVVFWITFHRVGKALIKIITWDSGTLTILSPIHCASQHKVPLASLLERKGGRLQPTPNCPVQGGLAAEMAGQLYNNKKDYWRINWGKEGTHLPTHLSRSTILTLDCDWGRRGKERLYPPQAHLPQQLCPSFHIFHPSSRSC